MVRTVSCRIMNKTDSATAILYSMVFLKHTCPYGLKAKALLQRNGYRIEERWLTTREQVDAFKAEQSVKTTPQAFIDGARIGGYDDLRRHFGLSVPAANAMSYRPVGAVFAVSALMAIAASWTAIGSALTRQAGEWFIAFSMCVLALLKLQDVERFSNTFLGYDLVARRWVPYSYVYPYAELFAGVLMTAHAFTWLSAPTAFVIGVIGSVSVFKAVYIERRELKCACVGGDSRVPLGAVSLLENVMMVAMAIWMVAAAY
jgi:glutaredoxin